MVLFDKPCMLYMLLFIATVATSTTDEDVSSSSSSNESTSSDYSDSYEYIGGRRALDQQLSTTLNKIITALQIVGKWDFNPSEILSFGRDEYALPEGLTEPLNKYDYVIVGAGSAGSALASRLTEDYRINVLLIEAGKPESILTDIPIIAPLFQMTEYATQYVTEKQNTSCWGMEDQRCVLARGKAVGGSSVINNMVYARGRAVDWDRIAAKGCKGWSSDDVLQYYKKSEQCHLKHLKSRTHRGHTGKVHVEDVNFRTPFAEAFLDAARFHRHSTGDYNYQESFGFVQATLNNGRRHSAAKAYLYPHRNRRNLHILHSTTVTKILIDDNNKAYGVQYHRYGLLKTVMVRREVIVSAGPIVSPQLLMLSGIGPAAHLKSLGIHVVKDLAVGRTLYDHLYFPGQIYLLNTTSATLHEKNAAKPEQIIKWFINGTGLAGSPAGVEAIGYIKTTESTDSDLVPDVELMDCGGSLLSDFSYDGSQSNRIGARITNDTFLAAFSSVKNIDTWSAVPVLLHPKSKGYLELSDTNPFSHPKIYTNYLTDSRDVAAMIDAIRTVQSFTKIHAFQRHGARLHKADYPQCKKHKYDSDAYWECALRTLSSSMNQQTGTCKMGPSSDPETVVDPELRVHGVSGLRVADSSIIPDSTSAHSSAPGMMIGEKAADIIKEAWKNVS